MTVLLLDNFDSFTYNLVDYFHQLHCPCTVLRNDVNLATIKNLAPQAIILSPGSGTPAKAGVMPEVIATYHNKVPIIGICLGHQAIGEFFGATLTHATQPMHGKLSMITCQKDEIFEGLPTQFQVVRYHSLVLTALPSSLVALAHTTTGELMALKHQKLPLYGIQFHPEAALTEHGLQLLGNWVRINKISS